MASRGFAIWREEGGALTRYLLMLSAIYLGCVGLALMFVPLQFGRGAVPADAGPALIALLRLLGGPFVGIAVLNWLSRNSPIGLLRAVIWSNVVGFGSVAANDMWGVASGQARDIAALFLVVHTLFALAFVLVALRGASWRRF